MPGAGLPAAGLASEVYFLHLRGRRYRPSMWLLKTNRKASCDGVARLVAFLPRLGYRVKILKDFGLI